MKLFRKLLRTGLTVVCSALLAGFVFSGCATSEEPTFTSTPAIEAAATATTATTAATSTNIAIFDGDSDTYRFQVGDLVRVTFSDTPEPLLAHEERIKEDGNITLPLIGAVKALGKRTGELQKEIRDRYVPKYYVRLTVTVSSLPPDLYYYVTGEVRAPGPKSYLSTTTVTKAISAAGGLNEFARKSKIQLTRANGTKVNVNWNKAVENSSADPRVFPGDSIFVPKSLW